MADGPGKYDPECVKVMEETEAEIVMLAIINGSKGTGFSVTSFHQDIKEKLPKILRNIADQIEGVS